MNNPIALRVLMIGAIMIATVAGFLALAYMKFPDSLLIVIPSVALVSLAVFFVQRSEKAARFNVYYTTVQEFGTPVSFGKYEAAFERNGTRLDVIFPHGEYDNFFKVNFYLPNLRQKFSIQNRTLATSFDDNCQVMQDSPLPAEYLVQSRNPEFIRAFLKNRAVRDEILNYKASFWGRILISLDDGNFELQWTPPVSEQIDGFYSVCQSAVVFHDELKKLSGN